MATINKPNSHSTTSESSSSVPGSNSQNNSNNNNKNNILSGTSLGSSNNNNNNSNGISGNSYTSDTRNSTTSIDSNKLTSSFSPLNPANQYYSRTSFSNTNENNNLSNMGASRVNTNVGSTPPVNMNPRPSFSNFLPASVRQSRNLSFSNLFFNPSDAQKDDVPFSFLPHLNENINMGAAATAAGSNSNFPPTGSSSFGNQDLNFSFSAPSGTTAAGHHNIPPSHISNNNSNNTTINNPGMLPHPEMMPPSNHHGHMITPGSAPTANEPTNPQGSAKSSIVEPLSQRAPSFYTSPSSNQQQQQPQHVSSSSTGPPPVFNTEVFANANSTNLGSSGNSGSSGYNPVSSSSSSRNQSLGNIFNYASGGDMNNLHRPSIGFGFGGFYTGSHNGSNGNLINLGGISSTANNGNNNNNNNNNNRRNSSILPSLPFQEFGNEFDTLVKKDSGSKPGNDFQVFSSGGASSDRNSINKSDDIKFNPVIEEHSKIQKGKGGSKSSKKAGSGKKMSKSKNQSNKLVTSSLAERISLDVKAIDEKQELLKKTGVSDSEKPKLGATKVDQLMLVIQARAKGVTKPISQAPDGSILNDSEVLPSSIELIGGVDKIDAETKREAKKKLQCKYCQKIFTQATHLEVHLRSHIGYKPFKCSVCERSFTQGGNLRTHLRSHTGEKPFKCEECGREFSRKGNLEAHMYTHSNAKPFKCYLDNCDKAFNQLGNLKAHQNRFHLKTVAELTHKLAVLGDDLSHLPPDERRTIEYFMDIYKNSNKGIKGRGKKANDGSSNKDSNTDKVTKPRAKSTKTNKSKLKTDPSSSSMVNTINPADVSANQNKINSTGVGKSSQNTQLTSLQMPPLPPASTNINPLDFQNYPMHQQQHPNAVANLNYSNYSRFGNNNDNQSGNNNNYR